ncbi:MAG: sigma-70 family RNA polymerase sigma factor [Chitinophagaceae bacterium]|nr:sigma-70 family RNA polymerase sigma factor [Chitinophagaceae bacterium]
MAHDRSMLENLYRRNFEYVRDFILSNRGTEVQAEDTYQESFLTVWRNVQLERFKPESEADFNAYLFRVCRNKWVDVLRSKTFKDTVLTEGHLFQSVTNEGLYNDEIDKQIELIKAHFDALGNSCKEILSRFYFFKESLRDISTALGLTEASARNTKYRCIQKLRDLINHNS